MMGVMKKEDQVKYMANIFYLIFADGEVELWEGMLVSREL